MAKRVKVIGCCPCCKRSVGGDMRPINEVGSQRMEEILNGLTSSSSSSSLLTVSDLRDANIISQISLEEDTASIQVAHFTDHMLESVMQELERPYYEESTLTDDETETIMAMLREEQVIHNRYMHAKELAKKRKRATSKRRRK